VNRAQRRAAHRQIPSSVRKFAAASRCPDCLSENTEPVRDARGIWHIETRHDATCPWLAQHPPLDEFYIVANERNSA
jgi:hypothetical protein